MDWCLILPEWLTAVGTLLVVVVALFLKPIRDRINRPKIEMSFSDNKQCLVETTTGANSNDKSKQLRIRVKLENKGNYIATYAALYVDSFYKNLKSVWIVRTDLTPNECFERIRENFTEEDRCFVVDITQRNRQGWLPSNAWEWIKIRDNQ